MKKTENTNRLVWQKWFDPFGEDDLDAIEEHSDFDTEELYEEENHDFEENIEETEHEANFYKKPTRVVLTPMGMIPYTDNTASSKIFNFWVGHTNFNITPAIAARIEKIEGVETLDIFTRYRFRIGIGKLFDPALIMSSITENIYDYLNEMEQ